MKFEDIVKDICGNEWQEDIDSKNGGYAIAMILSFMTGQSPTLSDLSKDIGIDREELDEVYQRLLTTGMFSKNFDAKSDLELLGKDFSKTSKINKNNKLWTKNSAYRNAWCHIAGIGSGYIDRNIDKKKMK